jgi:hypothetical protein
LPEKPVKKPAFNLPVGFFNNTWVSSYEQESFLINKICIVFNIVGRNKSGRDKRKPVASVVLINITEKI